MQEYDKIAAARLLEQFFDTWLSLCGPAATRATDCLSRRDSLLPELPAMPRSSRPKSRSKPHRGSSAKQGNVGETTLRIVGGHFRGRKLKYAGDTRVRPMKDRVREALFNLLGPAVKGTFAVDLFGGTGALALEAISRGSVGAQIIERHLPTSKVIRENIETLELQDKVELLSGDTFRWFQNQPVLPETSPWVVFVSPPYRFFTERTDEMLGLITGLMSTAPLGSLFAVEATKEFDFGILPVPDQWDVRTYHPAVVGVLVATDSVRSQLPAGSDE